MLSLFFFFVLFHQSCQSNDIKKKKRAYTHVFPFFLCCILYILVWVLHYIRSIKYFCLAAILCVCVYLTGQSSCINHFKMVSLGA